MDFDPTKIVDDTQATGATAVATSHFNPLAIVDDPLPPQNPKGMEFSKPKEEKGFLKPIPTKDPEQRKLVGEVEGYSIRPLDKFFGKLFRDAPEESVAKAANIYSISQATKLSMSDVQNNYDELKRMSEITGMKPDLNGKQYTQALMDLGMLSLGGEMGALMTAGEWVKAGEMGWKAFKGVATFTILDKALPVEKYFNQDTSDTTKVWARLADLTVKGALSGGLAEFTPRFGELKNMFFGKKLNIPQSVNLSLDQVNALPNEARVALGIEDRHIEAAKTSNLPINVPAQKIMDLAKEPYWQDIKKTFGVTAGDKPYVVNKPIELSFGKDDRATSQGIREEFSGIKNEQIVKGNQLSEEIKTLVKDKKERQGMFWYKAARGNTEVLTEMLNNPKMEAYQDQIKSALNLSPKSLKALEMVEKYYQEAGQVSQEIGTIKDVTENYQNRIYKPEPPKDFIKTEVKGGLKQTTSHSKARVFDTEFDAAIYGKEFATTDVADALSIHNEEMARVNTARKLAETMVNNGVGAWSTIDEVPSGWTQVGNLRKGQTVFTAPKGIAKGLEAITDPNFIKKIEPLRNIQKYQGIIKTVDLSYSFFHHFSMVAQTMYQGGIREIMKLPEMNKILGSPAFGEMELDFVQHTGMTAKVEAVQDILRNLTEKNPDVFSKITNFPGVKQYLKGAEKSSEFLFGRLQRYLKVADYGSKISNWVADNPLATNAEVKAAKLGFAKEINSVYGGLNWEAMGMTKSNLSLLRLGLLAPDWTISNVQLLQFAVGDKGMAGQAARGHILRALIGGMIATEGLNKITTGHFTDQNPKGHLLEVQIAPDVYVSLLRGGIGDITKFASMVSESGGAGALRFAQGKLAPFTRTAIGLAAAPMGALDYTGHRIIRRDAGPFTGTYDILRYTLAGAGPIPFSLGTLPKYLMNKNIQKTLPGALAIAGGVGRYSKAPKRESRNPTAGEDIDRLLKDMTKGYQ